ncbi:MAG: FliH/SctL family protein [Candidatus Omnitrophica bacterium]|nr:FliH/SctL family protein [Candidatus Omnitrophota bacterium]MCM8826384.1 FliH/SctL family protein [Candidatus Omnitrophota bacterium]
MGIIKKGNIWQKASLRELYWEDFLGKIDNSQDKEIDLTDKKLDYSDKKLEEETLKKEIIKEAEESVKKIIEQANVEAQKIKTDAFKQALEEAKKEAERQAEAKYKELWEKEIVKLRSLLEIIRQSYNEIVKKTESSLVKLSLSIAKKIIKQESEKNKEVVIAMVKEGLSRVLEKTNIKVRVNPEQLPIVYDYRGGLFSSPQVEGYFDIIADPTISKGSCIIETEGGSIDLRIEKQFSEIRKNLTGEFSNDDEY